MIKFVTFFLVGMLVLGMFGKLRVPGIGGRKMSRPGKCPRCGRHRIGPGKCACAKGKR